MNKSESIKELATALAKAQAEIEGATKDKTNPHFRSKYADLGNVVEAVRPALSKNGLSFVQVCHEADHAAKIETIILHSSGEWLSAGPVTVPVSKSDAQGFGSAMTYARRYSLSAAFGVAQQDDDGEAAAKAAPKHHDVEKLSNVKPTAGLWEELSEKQQSRLLDMATVIIEYYQQGDIESAAGELQDADLPQEEKAALWTRFDSKLRTALTNAIRSKRVA